MAERQEKYKNEGKNNELRRRRIDMAVELRRSKQEDKFSKRRFTDEEIIIPKIHDLVSNEQLREILENLHLNSLIVLIENIGIIRKSLTVSKPPIDLVLESNSLPVIIQCLTHHECPTLQYEAAWVLTNLASGDTKQTKTVIENGAVPVLISLLGSDVLQTKNQALWALGNISGDCAEFRDFCVDSGILGPLFALITPTTDVSTLRICAWAVSNLCRYKKPIPRLEVIKACLPYLNMMLSVNDTNVVADSLWAILYVCDASEMYSALIVEFDLVPCICGLLSTLNNDFVPQILRIIGNISYLDDTNYSQVLIDNGVFGPIKVLMSTQSLSIRKDAVWVVSNIVAGSQQHIALAIESGCVEVSFEKLKTDKIKVKCEALWVMKNILADGTDEQIMYIFNFDNLIKLIGEFLLSQEGGLLGATLDCVFSLLKASKNVGIYDDVYASFEKLGILDTLEDLQNSSYRNISNLSSSIISEFFGGYLLDENDDIILDEDYSI